MNSRTTGCPIRVCEFSNYRVSHKCRVHREQIGSKVVDEVLSSKIGSWEYFQYHSVAEIDVLSSSLHSCLGGYPIQIQAGLKVYNFFLSKK